MSHRRFKPLVLGSLLLALWASAVVPTAQAKYDPLSSGVTKINFDRSFMSILKRSGVQLEAIAPARLRAGSVTFPITGGKFDPVARKGIVEHEGVLVFRAGRKRLPFRALQVKPAQRHSPISVKVGGGQLKLGQTRSLAVARAGFGSRIAMSDLTLAPKVATRLAKKLRLRGVFKEGLPIGRAVTLTVPSTISVAQQGRARLTLAPDFVAKLDSLFVAVNPIFPAEHIGAEFTFPIFGGTIAADASEGRVDLTGALEFLQQGGGQLFWREPAAELALHQLTAEVDVEPSPPYSGKVGRLGISSTGFLAPAAADATRRTVSVGMSLALAPEAAVTLNELFAKPQGKTGVFAAGETIADLSLAVQGE
jgi:hypothetical protein